MIKATPTKNLTGVEIEGDFEDLYELMESIYRITGLEEDQDDFYWTVKNRLLGVCYDIRHSFMGDRNVKLVDNGVNEELMKWHSMVLPENNVHYSAEILFPEAVFVALSSTELFTVAYSYYGEEARKYKEKTGDDMFRVNKYSDFLKDKAMISMLSSAILSALEDVIGEEEFEKLIKLSNNQRDFNFIRYLGQYVDKCNIEYLKTKVDKRSNKIKNITKRLIKKPEAYKNMEYEYTSSAKVHKCSVHELVDNRMEYPEEIEW